MLFLNKDPELAAAARRIVEEELQRETLSIVGWRDVPTNEGVLGEIALSSLPRIEQIFVNAPAGWRPRDMERRLFIARRRIEKRLEADKDFYVCSLSNLVNIYKGLCMPADLPRFYLDLADLRLESAICLFHQRFSTNTVPRWPLAHGSAIWRITVKSTPSPVTANGRVRVPINSRRRLSLICTTQRHSSTKPVLTPARWITCWNCCWQAGWISSALCVC